MASVRLPRVVLRAEIGFDARLIGARIPARHFLSPPPERCQLAGLLRELRRRFGARTITCDAESPVGQALLHARFADELHLTLRPQTIGRAEAATLTGPVEGPFLPHSLQGRLLEMRAVGGECRLRYRLEK